MTHQEKPMEVIASRVLDGADPEGERTRLASIPFAEFKDAFAADPIGSLRYYPFGCAQSKDDETDLEYKIMGLYRETALQSEEIAKVALEVFMHHPTKPQSPKPNPYTQGLMWNVMLKYPKLFLDQLSEFTGQTPEALHAYILTYADQVRADERSSGKHVSRVTASKAASRESGIIYPGIEDTVVRR